MWQDLRVLLWLRMRHAWTWAVHWAYVVNADLEDSKDPLDRLYLVYLVVLFGGWAALSWVAAIDLVGKAFLQVPPPIVTALLQVIPVVPPAVLAVLCLRFLHTSPLKLTSPDIAYLGAGPIGTVPLMLVDTVVTCVQAGAGSFLLGYLLGAGVQARGMGTAPIAVATLIALTAVAVVVGARLIGIVRLSIPPKARWGLSVFFWLVAVAFVLAWFVGVPVLAWPGGTLSLALAGGSDIWDCLLLLVAIAAGLMLVAVVSRRADMTTVIEESGLYAEIAPLRPMRNFDRSAYNEAVRRRRLATHHPRFHVPFGAGALALISRAVLSYLRQPGRLPSLLMWGGLVVPIGVLLMLGEASPSLYIPWVGMVIFGSPAELTRVFGDDVRNPMIRTHLPFGMLCLLLADSLPALVIATVTSVVVSMAVLYSGSGLGAGVVLAILLNVVTVLCYGIGTVKLPAIGRRVGFEAAMVGAIALIALFSLLGGAWSAAIAAALVTLVAAAIVHFGREQGIGM